MEPRFWSKVDKRGPNDCWPWLGHTNAKGYGTFNSGIGTHIAHRIAFILTVGPIPNKLFACHHCDNPPCCNPKHIFLGTNADNMADCARKGRTNPKRGEEAFTAKLTEAKVREIVRLYVDEKISSKKLGPMFGVHPESILGILRGTFWKHLGLPKVEIRGKKGGINHFAKLNESKVLEIRLKHDEGMPHQMIADHYGVKLRSIQLIISRKTWNHI